MKDERKDTKEKTNPIKEFQKFNKKLDNLWMKFVLIIWGLIAVLIVLNLIF